MPESPEVDALAGFLDTAASGRTVEAVDILEFRTVKTRATPPATLIGRTITGAARHGKHIEVMFGDESLVVSLGRHGWIRWVEGDDDETGADATRPPSLATVSLSGEVAMEMTDAGTWVSLGLFVVGDPREVPAIAKLGPDPVDPDFTRAAFDAALGARRKQIKAILQEQESLAGIGNAYSDEILHAAMISPVAHAAALGDGERQRLFEATVAVLRDAIGARRGVPIDQLKPAKVAAMRVHGRTNESCPVCGDTVRDFSFSGASAQYCPTCQTEGVRL
ncbi:Fpg/Nei family DNA glycosylase [Microbacterium sp. HD4P20]|uniref:DNA-formamidopyrimidine glycosylase family protein n=1 Tax=Microbacterium sp. HD4P20 TaxID=2864874 RepID=UPI001C64206A|nr:DNA-formamidopyrimidine glycosylase family protein [Microbacterium sp. HD4P20]MCP2637862.1 Fpg/Nei family DNA glycosylase [Microbacterium sp. HD4P20]